MSGDINVQTFSGKVNITSNLLVGSSHLFVDTINNRVGITTADPDAGLHVNSNAYVDTNFRVGSDIAMNVTSGRITAGSFEGDGSLLENVPGDSGSWVKGSSSNVHLATSTDKVGIGTTSPEVPFNVVGNNALSGNPNNAIASFRATTAVPGTNDAGVVIGSINGNTPYIADVSTASIGLSFYTQNAPRMRILANGNVGLGTTSPDNSLHIYKNADERTSGLFIEKANGGTGTAAIFFGVNHSTENPGVAKAAIFYERNSTGGRGDLKFCNDASSDANNVTPEAADTRMIIKNNGNVGIGATSEFKLDVGGSYTSGRSLAVRSGDTNSSSDSIQILFGYANGLDYAHSIRTRHNSAGYDNAIDFWCWDTSTAASTYGNKRVMSVEAKEIAGAREGLVTISGVMIATSQPRWSWYGHNSGGWTNSGYLTYSHNLVTQTRVGGSAGGGYAVAQVAGVYCVSWCAFTEHNVAVNTGVQYEIRKNNNQHMRNYHNQPKTNYSATGGLQCLVALNVGDHVRVYINSAVHHNANSCFSGFLVA